jgi:uncharacterized membrane protein YfcA
MSYLVVCAVALLAAGLTLYSGFGLGTLLLPAFAFFFPLELAVAATAVVHLANNLFKLGLVGRHASWGVVVRFGVPAAVGALVGAWALASLSGLPPLARWSIGARQFEITPIKLVLGALIAIFALLEVSKRAEALRFGRRWLLVGGAVSGFFGGLSGHQGALRSAFLIRLGLSKQAFIGTGVAAAVMVDAARLAVYGASFLARDLGILRERGGEGLVLAATASAWLGSFLGARLMQAVTLRTLQWMVAAMLLLVAGLLIAGLV